MSAARGERSFIARVVRKSAVADGVVGLRLEDADGRDLPIWEPGAHVDLVIEGEPRQYSLCGDVNDRAAYEIAVLREADGRGGSAYIHDVLDTDDLVTCRGPRNHFPLVKAGRYVFIAGGIGITPIIPMLDAVDDSAQWELIYGGRSRSSMAFRDELGSRHGDRVVLWPQDEFGLLDLESALGTPLADCVVYCCGPEPLLEAVDRAAEGWAAGSVHVERFAPKPQENGVRTSFEVHLARRGQTLSVPPEQSIVEVLKAAGIEIDISCEEGICGTCETTVLDGVPDHRDSILTEDERAQNTTMFLCVSRSLTPTLRLDL